MLDSYFQNESLKLFLIRLTGYLSSDPTKLTVQKMAPIFGYYFDGGYYPVGSSQVLADALVHVIQENGGRIYLRTPVKKILVEDNRAVGIELGNGNIHRAQAVVSNADARRTFLELVGREHLPAAFASRVDAMKPSNSAIYVFLGVDFVPDIEPFVILRTAQGGRIGIITPSIADPSIAPQGHSVITLIQFPSSNDIALWNRRAPGYNERKHKFGDEMISLAERVIPDLSRHIVYRQEATPATGARYAWTTQGSIYGPTLGHGFEIPKSPIEDLYITGSAYVGAGVEAVAISGMLVADSVYPN
jgi:phytoene dehydrogenase-like protein